MCKYILNIDNQNLEILQQETQQFIESEWIILAKNSINDDKNLTSNLKKVIKMFKKV